MSDTPYEPYVEGVLPLRRIKTLIIVTDDGREENLEFSDSNMPIWREIRMMSYHGATFTPVTKTEIWWTEER